MDTLGGFIFNPPLNEKEKNYFDCYFQSTHCQRNEFLLGLYGCSYNKKIYEKNSDFQFDNTEEITLNNETIALEHVTNQNPWIIIGKKLVLDEYKKNINYHDLLLCVNELSLFIHHFFSKEPIAKKLDSEYFSFLEPRELQGKIYIKLDETASLFVIEVLEDKVKLCELNYIYKLPFNDKKEDNIILNGKLLEDLEKTHTLSKDFFARLKKQYREINLVDIKKEPLLDENYCSIFQYSPSSEINKVLHYIDLNNTIQGKGRYKFIKI